MQADNYFKVRAESFSQEFPFITEYSIGAADAEAEAQELAADLRATGARVEVSVYDATCFPDYPQVGDWAACDLREADEPDTDETIH